MIAHVLELDCGHKIVYDQARRPPRPGMVFLCRRCVDPLEILGEEELAGRMPVVRIRQVHSVTVPEWAVGVVVYPPPVHGAMARPAEPPSVDAMRVKAAEADEELEAWRSFIDGVKANRRPRNLHRP